ncbi:hypothetical protein [Nocardia sp. CA-135398]|uniref:hypothetical protein n=1 Tax=Nocardia sp. CA-135398 TaxID=3239977 RepID=UPI003D967BEF
MATGFSPIAHLRHVGIAVPNYERAIEFYKEVWGLVPVASDTGVTFFGTPADSEHYILRVRDDRLKRLDLIAFAAACCLLVSSFSRFDSALNLAGGPSHAVAADRNCQEIADGGVCRRVRFTTRRTGRRPDLHTCAGVSDTVIPAGHQNRVEGWHRFVLGGRKPTQVPRFDPSHQNLTLSMGNVRILWVLFSSRISAKPILIRQDRIH